MKPAAFFSLLIIAIAFGVALAPYALATLAWTAALLLICLLIWLAYRVLKFGTTSTIGFIISLWRDVIEYIRGMPIAWAMIVTRRLPNETSTFKRRLNGLLVLASYAVWLLVLLVVVRLMLDINN